MTPDPFAYVRPGDPNPRTTRVDDDEGDCPAERPARRGTMHVFRCTLDAGHPGRHLAEGPTFVLAVWSDGGPVATVTDPRRVAEVQVWAADHPDLMT